jgi:hypothetical protein
MEEDQEPKDVQPRHVGEAVRKRAMAVRPPTKKKKAVTAKRIQAVENQRRALELRKSGATYDQIAQVIGYSDASGASKAVQRALQAVIQEPAKEVLTINMERLNHMLLTVWPKINAGDERAIDTGLRIMDKIDRLMGTEQAQQIEHKHVHAGAVLVVDGDEDAYIAAMKRMAGIVGSEGQNKTDNGVVEVQEAPAELLSVNQDTGGSVGVGEVREPPPVEPPAPTPSSNGQRFRVLPEDDTQENNDG